MYNSNMYNFSKIEKKWQKRWLTKKVYEPDLKKAKKPFYNLMMFPYPSAEGLHVGNMYAFVGTDVYGRLKRMQGYDVFEPIGLDGFGIHSENYAIKIGRHPMNQAKISEKNFYRQLQMIGNGFAWNERLETYDPDYYKWTQWIFTQMFKRGLAYRKKSPVNWCPSCKTVLADEQVIEKSKIQLKVQNKQNVQTGKVGVCERCETQVIKKELEQWFFRITKYADKLLNNLNKIDWSEKVKIAQRNWIGKSEGAIIKFPISNFQFSNKSQKFDGQNPNHYLEVFTTRLDTLFGVTFMVISPERAKLWLDIGWQASKEASKYIRDALKRRSLPENKKSTEKTGIFSGVSAINPANKEKIPVWISDYVLGDVGTGVIMAVPAHDERDWEFAHKFKLPVIMVVCPNYPEETCPVLKEAYTGPGHLVASGKFDGMPSERAKDGITNFVDGTKNIQYRLRDWLISRQRYWGPPIPIIYCRKCWENQKSKIKNKKMEYGVDYTVFNGEEFMICPVPEKDLPVILPKIKNFRPTGTDKSPLASVEKFYKVRCPICRSWARRETDVSDTFLDSAWYYLGYLILGNQKLKIKNQKSPFSNPSIKRWLPVNIYIGGAEHSVLHLLYVRFLAMVFKDIELVSFEEPFPKFRAHGLIIKDGSKMSKSKGNVVNPDEYIKNFGADALRMYLMFLGPYEDGGDFQDTGIRGVTRFLKRVWDFGKADKFAKAKNDSVEKMIHKTIKKVTDDIENLAYNTAISAIMILMNEFESNSGGVGKEQFKVFLKLLSPFAPHITEELWEALHGKNSIHKERWPKYEADLAKENTFELLIQVDGKLRAKTTVNIGISEGKAKEIAFTNEAVMKHITNKGIKKIIFVPNRLLNIVT